MDLQNVVNMVDCWISELERKEKLKKEERENLIKDFKEVIEPKKAKRDERIPKK